MGEADNEKAYLFAMSLQKDSIKTLDDFKKAVLLHTADKTTKKLEETLVDRASKLSSFGNRPSNKIY